MSDEVGEGVPGEVPECTDAAALANENASLRAALTLLSEEHEAVKALLAQRDATVAQLVARVRNLETQLVLGELNYFKRLLGLTDPPQRPSAPQQPARRVERRYLKRDPVPAYALPAKIEAALAETGAAVVQLREGEVDEDAVNSTSPLQSTPFEWWEDVVIEPPPAASPERRESVIGDGSPVAATPPRAPTHSERADIESEGDDGEGGSEGSGDGSAALMDDIAHNRISQDEMREIMRIAAERRAVRFQQGGSGGKGKRRAPPPAERSPSINTPLMRWPSSF